MKALIKKDMGTPVFIAALFTVVIYRSKLRVHQQKSRKRRYSVCNIHAHTLYLSGILLSHNNEVLQFAIMSMNLALCLVKYSKTNYIITYYICGM